MSDYDDMTASPVLASVLVHPSTSRCNSNNKSWIRRKWHRAWWNSLVLVVCVLSVLPVPAMSAPAQARVSESSSSHGAGPSGDPKWIKPCGKEPDNEAADSVLGSEFDSEMEFAENEELFNIVLVAKTAQSQANRFRDEYVKSTFNVDFDQHHQSWKSLHYDWLPVFPKSLGERTPVEHLQQLELEQALKDSYSSLQKIAVGLEQVAWDQEESSGFKSDFRATEYQLKAVLCEILFAMSEHSVEQHPDVTRSIMSREFREISSGNSSVRNLRDWFIFRDYMNGLEYVIDVFDYFMKKASS